MGKDWKSWESAKLAILSHYEPLEWEKIGKVANQAKLAIPSHSEPLRWQKIGKVANWAKLAIPSHSEPLWWAKIAKSCEFIVCIAVAIIVIYFCCTKCRHTRTIFKYCFLFLPISRIVRKSRRTDLFVEVTNITKGNGIWAHFASTGCFPLQICMSRLIQKEDVQIETFCCIFKRITINWSSIIVTGISRTTITMPDIAYVSIFMDNDLTHITEDHFEIKLIARLLNQIYVIQPPMLPPRYDDAPPGEYEYSQPHTSTDGTRPSAPQFPEHLHLLLTCS